MPTIDDILTMEPVFLRIMSPEIIWQIKNTEVRLTASTLSQSSFFMWKLKVSRVMPALFTSTSNPPASASAAFTAAVSSSAFDASAQNSWNFVLWSAANFSISAFASEGCEHMPHTSAPSAKKVSAIFLPIPRDEPVTNAFLFSSNICTPKERYGSRLICLLNQLSLHEAVTHFIKLILISLPNRQRCSPELQRVLRRTENRATVRSTLCLVPLQG